VTVEPSEADPATMEVRLDGSVVAYVPNAEGLQASDISLVPVGPSDS
jgi:hypothetical protein